MVALAEIFDGYESKSEDRGLSEEQGRKLSTETQVQAEAKPWIQCFEGSEQVEDGSAGACAVGELHLAVSATSRDVIACHAVGEIQLLQLRNACHTTLTSRAMVVQVRTWSSGNQSASRACHRLKMASDV